MTQHCCVENCKHNRRNSSCTFKRFPSDPQKSKLWETLIQQGHHWKRTSWDRICECHFEDDQYERNRQDGLRKLRWDAVPSLFGSRAKVPPPLVKLPKGATSKGRDKNSARLQGSTALKSKEEGKGNEYITSQQREQGVQEHSGSGTEIVKQGEIQARSASDDLQSDKLSTTPEVSNYVQHNMQRNVQQDIIVDMQQNTLVDMQQITQEEVQNTSVELTQEDIAQITQDDERKKAQQNQQIIVQDVGNSVGHVVGQVLGQVVSLEDGNEVAEVVNMDEYDAEEVEVEIEDCSDEDIISEGVVTTYQVQVFESGADESDEGVEGEVGESSPKQSVHHRTKRIVIKVPSSKTVHQQNDIDPDSVAQALFKSPVHERSYPEELPEGLAGSNNEDPENLMQSSSITTGAEESEQESSDFQPPARASVEVQTMDISEEQLAEYGEQYTQIYEEQSDQGDQNEQVEYGQVSFSAYPPGQSSLYMVEELPSEKQAYHPVEVQDQVSTAVVSDKAQSSLDLPLEPEVPLEISNQLHVGSGKVQPEKLINEPAVDLSEPQPVTGQEQQLPGDACEQHQTEDAVEMLESDDLHEKHEVDDACYKHTGKNVGKQQESEHLSEEQQSGVTSLQLQTVNFGEQQNDGNIYKQEIHEPNQSESAQDLDVQQQVGNFLGYQKSSDLRKQLLPDDLSEQQHVGDAGEQHESTHLGKQLQNDTKEQLQTVCHGEEAKTADLCEQEHLVVALQNEVSSEKQYIEISEQQAFEGEHQSEACSVLSNEVSEQLPNKLFDDDTGKILKDKSCEEHLEVREVVHSEMCGGQSIETLGEQANETGEEQPDATCDEQLVKTCQEQRHQTCEEQLDEMYKERRDEMCEDHPSEIREEQPDSLPGEQPHKQEEQHGKICEEQPLKTCEKEPRDKCEALVYGICDGQLDKMGEEEYQETGEHLSDVKCSQETSKEGDHKPDVDCELQSLKIIPRVGVDRNSKTGEQSSLEICEEPRDTGKGKSGVVSLEKFEEGCSGEPVIITNEPPSDCSMEQSVDVSRQPSSPLLDKQVQNNKHQILNKGQEDSCINSKEGPAEIRTDLAKQPTLHHKTLGLVEKNTVISHGQQPSVLCEEIGVDAEENLQDQSVDVDSAEHTQLSSQTQCDQQLPAHTAEESACVDEKQLSDQEECKFENVPDQQVSGGIEIENPPAEPNQLSETSEPKSYVEPAIQPVVITDQQAEVSGENEIENPPAEPNQLCEISKPNSHAEQAIQPLGIADQQAQVSGGSEIENPPAEPSQLSEISEPKSHVDPAIQPLGITDQQAHISDSDSERKSVITKAVRSSVKENVLKSHKEVGIRQLRSGSKDTVSPEISVSHGVDSKEVKPSQRTEGGKKQSPEHPEASNEKITKSSKGFSKDKSEPHNILDSNVDTQSDNSDHTSVIENRSKGAHGKSFKKESSVKLKPTDRKTDNEPHGSVKKKKQNDQAQKREGQCDQNLAKDSKSKAKGSKKCVSSSETATSSESVRTTCQDKQLKDTEIKNSTCSSQTTGVDSAVSKSSQKTTAKSIGEGEISSDTEASQEKMSSSSHMHLRSSTSPEKSSHKSASNKMSLRSKASSEASASKESDKCHLASEDNTSRKRGVDSLLGSEVEKSEKKSLRVRSGNSNQYTEKTPEVTGVTEELTHSHSVTSHSKFGSSGESSDASHPVTTSSEDINVKKKTNDSSKERMTNSPEEDNVPSQELSAVKKNVDDRVSVQNTSKRALGSNLHNTSTTAEGVAEDETSATTSKLGTRRGKRRTDVTDEVQEQEASSSIRKIKSSLKKALESPTPLRQSVRVSKSTEKAIASGLNLRHRNSVIENKPKEEDKVDEKAEETLVTTSRRGKRKTDANDQHEQESTPARRRRGTRSSESSCVPGNADGASSEGEDLQKGAKKGRGVKRKGQAVDQAQEVKHCVRDEEVQRSFELTPEITAKVSKMCRVCGLEQDSLLNVFGTEGKTLNLVSKIHNHLPIKIIEQEPLPVGVCHSCVVTLIACESLVEKSMQVDKRLRTLYNCPAPAPDMLRGERGGDVVNEPAALESVSPARVPSTASSDTVPVEAENSAVPSDLDHTESVPVEKSTLKALEKKALTENTSPKKTLSETVTTEAVLVNEQPGNKASRPSGSRMPVGKGSAGKASGGVLSSTNKKSANKALSDKASASGDKIPAEITVIEVPSGRLAANVRSSSGKQHQPTHKSCTDAQPFKNALAEKPPAKKQHVEVPSTDKQPLKASSVDIAAAEVASQQEASKEFSENETFLETDKQAAPVRDGPKSGDITEEASNAPVPSNEGNDKLTPTNITSAASPTSHPEPSELTLSKTSELVPSTPDISQTSVKLESLSPDPKEREQKSVTGDAEESDVNVSPMKRFGNTYGSRSKAGIWEKIEKEMEQLHDEPSASTSTTEEFHIVDLELNVEDGEETTAPAPTSPKSVVDSILGDWSGDEDDAAENTATVITIASNSSGEMIIPDMLPSASRKSNGRKNSKTPCLFGEEEASDAKHGSQLKQTVTKGKHVSKEESFWPAPAPGLDSTQTGDSDPVDVSWKCSVCGSRGKSIAKFLEHKKSHQNDHKLINCTMCSESFTNLRLFTMHMKIHQGDDDEDTGVEVQPVRDLRRRNVNQETSKVEVDSDYTPKADGLYQCSECMNSFSEVESLREHKLLHAKDPIVFKCAVCRRTYFQKKEYQEHLNSHQPGKPQFPMFHCAKCELKFASQKEFAEHVTMHGSSGGKIRCELCSKEFESRNKLRSHNSAVHKGLNYKCHLCDKVYHKRISLVEHIRKHTGENPYACEVCDKRFNRLANYKAHMMIHENARRYECPYCGKRFNRQSIQQRHMKTHTSEPARTHRCRVCESLFLTVQEMYNHLKIHPRHEVERAVWLDEKQRMALTSFPCKVCKTVFGRVEDVISHMPVHTDDERDIAVKLKNPRLECDICGKILFSKRTYKTHRNSHIDGKPFTCKICGKGYATSTGLNYHVLSHTGERPHQCSFCAKGYKNATDLKIHMRSHTGDFPFKCELCNKAFRSASSLMKHGDVHKEERPYKCGFCGLSFKRESTKLNHERIHTNDRRYKCKVCSRSFIQKGACDAHEKLHFRSVGGTEVIIRKLESGEGDDMNVEILEQEEHFDEEEIIDEDEDDEYIIYEDDENDNDDEGDEGMEEEEEREMDAKERAGKQLSDPLLANHVANVPGLSITPISGSNESAVPGLSITPVSVTNESAPSSADSSVHITVL